MAIELPTGYHLKNFLTLIRFVRSQYADLLKVEELDYAENFESLSEQAQSLYVRLVLRKGPVFRSDKLRYVDIPNVDLCATELASAGYLDYTVDENELLELLTKAELLVWAPDAVGAKKMKRDELVIFVQSAVELSFHTMPFSTFRPLGADRLLLYRLLFFGNLNQDFSEFVLADMGMLKYENYTISPSSRLFNSRESIDHCWKLYEIGEACEELILHQKFDQLGELANQIPAMSHNKEIVNSVLFRRQDRLLNYIGRHLERQDFIEDSLYLYGLAQSPPARERRVRILNKQGKEPESLRLCEEIILSAANEEELEFATRFAQKISKKLYGESSVDAEILEFKTQNLELEKPNSNSLGVEEAVRLWFEKKGDQCFYVENGLVPSLFGLCFWDIIFIPLQGAFVNPFQRGPLDLFSSSFRLSRDEAISARLQELELPGEIERRVYSIFAEKKGITNYFVRWELLTSELLDLAITRIPDRDLISMFLRMLFDLRSNCSGFPDLINFPSECGCGSPNDRNYEMVEVKGPGDKLQLNQKRWIKAFSSNNIPFSLVRVEWLT